VSAEVWTTIGVTVVSGVLALALAGHRALLARFDKLERRLEAICSEVKDVRERLARLEGKR